MGRSVNKVTLIGTLGRDPEVRTLSSGNAVANINLATDESYNDRTTGQKVERTEWHRITVYGRLAEIVQQYLRKGSRAYFEGRLQTREWEKDGVKRYTTEIIANDMMMLDRASDNMPAAQSQYDNYPQQSGGYAASGYQPQQPQPMQPPQQQAPMGQPYAAPQPAQAMQQPHAIPQSQPMQQPVQQPQAAPQPIPQPAPAPIAQPTGGFDNDFDDDIPF